MKTIIEQIEKTIFDLELKQLGCLAANNEIYLQEITNALISLNAAKKEIKKI